MAIMGDSSANEPCAAMVLEASQLGPIQDRRDDGHPSMRRQDRLKPGILFSWKLRNGGCYGHPLLCPSSQLLG